MTDVAVVGIEKDMLSAVREVFRLTVPGENLIKSSGEVYLKHESLVSMQSLRFEIER